MAKKKNQEGDLKVGDRVSFLRSHDKSVSLTGTVAKIHDKSVDVELDNGSVETAHADDVTLEGEG